MKLLFALLSPFMLFAFSPFETPRYKYNSTTVFDTPKNIVQNSSFFNSEKSEKIDTSAYDAKNREENMEASKNSRIICRYTCDKKVYKEQKIMDAVEFYKKERKFK